MAGAFGTGQGQYINLRDMLDGGGAGRSGPEFEGANISGLLNMLGIDPLAARESEVAVSRPLPRPEVQPPGRTYGAPLTSAQMPPATRMGVGPDNFQYSAPAPAPAPAPGSGVLPQDYAPPVGPGYSPAASQYGFGQVTGGMGAAPAPLSQGQPALPSDLSLDAFERWLNQDASRAAIYPTLTEDQKKAVFLRWIRGGQ